MNGKLGGLWGMSAAQAGELEKEATPVNAPRGALIVRRGSVLPGIFALGSGILKLSVSGADGEERVLRLVFAGDSFGEPTALVRKPSAYDAFALTDAKLLSIPTAAIFALVRRDARFAQRLVVALAERSHGILNEFAAATTQRGAQRLAGYLTSLAGSTSSVHLPVSKTVVAALLGMKKETLSRLLRQFAADGIIGVDRRAIAILDAERLRSCSTR
jgi:CRP/FNR family transcriptional regulator, dissimilatory nitrate respiration regulator